MEKVWIIPICLFIIGYFGIFWTLNLSDVELTINLNTDNNTLDVMKSIEKTINNTQPKTISYAPIECFVNSTHLNYSCVNK